MTEAQARADEIQSLTDEVTRLRAQVDAPRRPGRARAVLAVALVTLGTLLAPVAVVAGWTKLEVADTDRFVATLAPLIDDPAVSAFLVDEIVVAIEERIDIPSLTADLFAGIASLDLPPRAQAALGLLEQPAVEGVRSLIRTQADRLVTSDRFAQVWEQTLRLSHTQLTGALDGNESQALVISDSGDVGIQLAPLIAAVKEGLVERGFGLADRIPEVDRTIVVAQSADLVQARAAYQLLDVLGFVIPWVSLLLIAAGVIVARRRARAAMWAGGAVAVTMALLASGVAIGQRAFVLAVSPDHLPADVAVSIYDALVPLVYSTSLAVGIAGLLVVIVAYFAGPFRGAERARQLAAEGAERLRARSRRPVPEDSPQAPKTPSAAEPPVGPAL